MTKKNLERKINSFKLTILAQELARQMARQGTISHSVNNFSKEIYGFVLDGSMDCDHVEDLLLQGLRNKYGLNMDGLLSLDFDDEFEDNNLNIQRCKKYYLQKILISKKHNLCLSVCPEGSRLPLNQYGSPLQCSFS